MLRTADEFEVAAAKLDPASSECQRLLTAATLLRLPDRRAELREQRLREQGLADTPREFLNLREACAAHSIREDPEQDFRVVVMQRRLYFPVRSFVGIVPPTMPPAVPLHVSILETSRGVEPALSQRNAVRAYPYVSWLKQMNPFPNLREAYTQHGIDTPDLTPGAHEWAIERRGDWYVPLELLAQHVPSEANISTRLRVRHLRPARDDGDRFAPGAVIPCVRMRDAVRAWPHLQRVFTRVDAL